MITSSIQHLIGLLALGIVGQTIFPASQLRFYDQDSKQAHLGWQDGRLDYDDGLPIEDVVPLVRTYVQRMRLLPWYTPILTLEDSYGHRLTIDWTVPEVPECTIKGIVTERAQRLLLALGCQKDSV